MTTLKNRFFVYTIAILIGIFSIGFFFYYESSNNYSVSYRNSIPDTEIPNQLKIKSTHPRILLPDLSSWNGENIPPLISSRLASYKLKGLDIYDACGSNSVMAKTACWLATGKSNTAKQLINDLKSFSIKPPEAVTNYGNAWELAFAYDYLTLYPGFSHADQAVVEEKLVHALKLYLRVLDSDSASLWHGRVTLAFRAWICAVVLEHTKEREKDLIEAVFEHVIDAFAAVALTEGWPEGYNYWIQDRAFEFTLAASAYINSVENGKFRNQLEKTIRRVGLWHIYATRPDSRIEGFGDEGSRIDLKDHTRRIIDIVGQISKDPVFSLYSRYIHGLHDRQSYYKDYHWGYVLFNDPTIDLVAQDINSLEQLDALLPKSDVFGKGAFNQIYMRSGWDNNATFISYRSGSTFSHHGHYDAGHFTIFKGAPLAINSSVYGKFFSENRLNYSIRTVAKNSLLIMRPNEKVQPNKFFAKKNVADGGQRIIIPTGSAVSSVAGWKNHKNNGPHFEGGRLIHFNNSSRDYVYVASDLTAAYNTPQHDEGGKGGKVTKVARELLYITEEDILIVHDHVITTDANYKKKWLLHTTNKPQAVGLQVLKGDKQNGILETDANQLVVKNKNSYLYLQQFYPKDASIRLIGGADYQYYVETDGDDSDLDGENFSNGAVNKPWFDVAQWRIEIQPNSVQKEHEFLIALSPSLSGQRKQALNKLDVTGNAKGLLSEKLVVLFADRDKKGKTTFKSSGGQHQLLMFGLPSMIEVFINNGNKELTLYSDDSGAINHTFEAGFIVKNAAVELRW